VVRQVPAALTEVLLFLLELFPLALRDVFPPLERLALVEQLFAVLLQLLLVLLDGLVVAQDLRDRLALAVVDGHHRDAVRTVGLLGDDLHVAVLDPDLAVLARRVEDRKSTRLNSSHVKISYAVFCLKKKSTAEDR